MYFDRNCNVRKFKDEVRGLHSLAGLRQINEVTDFVRLREPVRESSTLKFFLPLCLLSGLPDFWVCFSSDVNQEKDHMFNNQVL